jgi:hypothetical protein
VVRGAELNWNMGLRRMMDLEAQEEWGADAKLAPECSNEGC